MSSLSCTSVQSQTRDRCYMYTGEVVCWVLGLQWIIGELFTWKALNLKRNSKVGYNLFDKYNFKMQTKSIICWKMWGQRFCRFCTTCVVFFQTSILVCGKINWNLRLVFAVNVNAMCVLSNPSRHYQNATPKSFQTSAHFERFSG